MSSIVLVSSAASAPRLPELSDRTIEYMRHSPVTRPWTTETNLRNKKMKQPAVGGSSVQTCTWPGKRKQMRLASSKPIQECCCQNDDVPGRVCLLRQVPCRAARFAKGRLRPKEMIGCRRDCEICCVTPTLQQSWATF